MANLCRFHTKTTYFKHISIIQEILLFIDACMTRLNPVSTIRLVLNQNFINSINNTGIEKHISTHKS